jgi:hypothetical protein
MVIILKCLLDIKHKFNESIKKKIFILDRLIKKKLMIDEACQLNVNVREISARM